MNFRDLAPTLGAYLALPAVLLYPFGFFALFVQFVGYFDFEFYTAWYAASLADRMMVIGLGATILIVSLVGSVMLTWGVSQILCRHGASVGWGTFGQWHGQGAKLALVFPLAAFVLYILWRILTPTLDERGATIYIVSLVGSVLLPWGVSQILRRPGLSAKLILVSALGFVVYVLWSRILTAGGRPCLAIFGREYEESEAEAIRHQLGLWPDSFVPALVFVWGGVVGGGLIFAAYRSYRRSAYERDGIYPETGYNGIRFFSNGLIQGWLLPGLVVAYITGIGASLTLVGFMPAFMPFMTYEGVVGGNSERPWELSNTNSTHCDRKACRYLSHADGSWYVIHRYYENDVRRYAVLALDETTVQNPRITPLPEFNPRVSPLLPEFNPRVSRLPWPEDPDENICGAPEPPPEN